MSDSFHVVAESGEMLARSHLVAEMQAAASDEELFPVLVDGHVCHFHEIGGGYHREAGYHVVNLIHEVQGPDSPTNVTPNGSVEAHIDDTYFWLEISSYWEFGEYPDDDYTLSLQVSGYESGPYAFSEELQMEVDKRETEHSFE